MDYYVIRDVDSGWCIPTIKKGSTNAELADPLVNPPRLFTSRRGAMLAKAAWLKGIHVATWDYPDSDGYGGNGPYVDSITIKPVADRLRVKLEVAKAHLHLE